MHEKMGYMAISLVCSLIEILTDRSAVCSKHAPLTKVYSQSPNFLCNLFFKKTIAIVQKAYRERNLEAHWQFQAMFKCFFGWMDTDDMFTLTFCVLNHNTKNATKYKNTLFWCTTLRLFQLKYQTNYSKHFRRQNYRAGKNHESNENIFCC